MKNNKKSLLILRFGKISHRAYDKKWQKYGVNFNDFRRHFFRDYFLCVDDRSENDYFKCDESAFPLYIINNKMACHK